MGKLSKFCSKRIHYLTDPRLVCKFREIWPTGSRWNRVLLTSQKKTKFRLALASAWIAPKIHQSQRHTMYSECPKFLPNRFTAGAVIAERVNIVKSHHKVNPILGWSYSFEPSKEDRQFRLTKLTTSEAFESQNVSDRQNSQQESYCLITSTIWSSTEIEW